MEVLSYLQTRKIDNHHRFVVTNHRIMWFYAETRELNLLNQIHILNTDVRVMKPCSMR